MKIKTAKAALGAALTAAALALTACTGGGPTPTPTASETTTTPAMTATPTPTTATVEAPKSQDEALKNGFNSVKEFSSVLEDLSNTKNTDTKPLESIAQGPALTFAKDFVAASAKSTTKYSGSSTNTLESGYSGKLTVGTTDYEFGFVDMKVCEDSTKVVGIRPDGSTAPKADHPRVIIQYWAQYNPASKTWAVSNIKQDEVIPC